jgi:hypothetical protein
VTEGGSARDQALILAEELLSEIELGSISPAAIARKASRLARLLDDFDAMQWLQHEVAGYPRPMDQPAVVAAERSNRVAEEKPEGGRTYWTMSLGELELQIEACMAQIAAEGGPPAGEWALVGGREASARRIALQKNAALNRALLENVVGCIHQYVATKYQELRFGSAVESAFQVVRREVDELIGELVPEALPMISGAFENAASDNPEHWANAAATCRRLLKAVADRLRPPGEDVIGPNGEPIKMGDGNYINRLGDWIRQQTKSETEIGVFNAEVEYLEAQLKAADQAGQKGAHERAVTRLVLGDVLRLGSAEVAAASPRAQQADSAPVSADTGAMEATPGPPAADE